MSKLFDGFNVFISRHLFPPDEFDTVLKAVEENGSQVHIGFDLSRNGENDYHIISCRQHYKFKDLKSKGCKMIGYRCVLQCAKEGRPPPTQTFTCCLTMEAVKILACGFDGDQMVKINELMSEMGGALHTTSSSDLNSVIMKNVLAPEYKWALSDLKKPIVTYEWLKQCSDEHQVVPQESYKVLPFSGLKICVTGIQADKRKEIEKLILQNGGKYSAELTKKCTHLISDAAEGDKYKMAKHWGHISIVTMTWFDESIAQRACLNEESYPVQSGSLSSRKLTRNSTAQHSQEKDIGIMQSGSSSRAADSNKLVDCAKSLNEDPVPDATQSKDPVLDVKEADAEAPPLKTSKELNFDRVVANDSESDNNDQYLADCRISLVGFEASERDKLIGMVRKGGGSECLSLNDKLTHIVVGKPTEMERWDIVRTVGQGVNYAVKTSWLEDCDREKKRVPALQKYSAYDLVFPKGNLVTTQDREAKNNVDTEVENDGVDVAALIHTLVDGCDMFARKRLDEISVSCRDVVVEDNLNSPTPWGPDPHWRRRIEMKEDAETSRDRRAGTYAASSESDPESERVTWLSDHSGRDALLERIQNQNQGMVASLTNESATSKSVYFAHCTSEMIFITHLLTEEPEKLAGPLLADTYVTLLKGRNAWYGQMLAKGELSPDMGDSISGKGMIQGVSAVEAFFELLSQSSLNVLHPEEKKHVAPVELCPILKTLYKILISREQSTHAILKALRDENLNDPRERIAIAQSHAFYRPSLLGQQ